MLGYMVYVGHLNVNSGGVAGNEHSWPFFIFSLSHFLVLEVATLSETRCSGSVTLVNLAATYKYRDATLTAYVNNLFDKPCITNNQGDSQLHVGAPRMLGVALRYDFY